MKTDNEYIKDTLELDPTSINFLNMLLNLQENTYQSYRKKQIMKPNISIKVRITLEPHQGSLKSFTSVSRNHLPSRCFKH